MKHRKAIATLVALLAVLPLFRVPAQVSLATKTFTLRIDRRGEITSLYDRVHGKEYLALAKPAPLVTIKVGTRLEQPFSLSLAAEGRTLTLEYAGGIGLRIAALEKETHLVLEIVEALPEGKVDAAIWGPIPTTIGKIVGEIIGVVRDDQFAIGIQGLNVKTLGGYPINDEGFDMSRGRAAEKGEWGSVLQAYSLDRSRPRTIAVWEGNFPDMPVPPIAGETVVGSRIALFGCPSSNALETIGAVEVAEGLPHPMINGVWAKVSGEPGRSYLIAGFSEENVDELLGYAKRAGLAGLYHDDPFESWGHYQFKKKFFPHGSAGMKHCVEKGSALGLRVGAHTLTSFINTNDPYVTPAPDRRLAQTGSSTLARAVDATVRELEVASPEYFANEKANWLHAVVIDDELVRYRAASSVSPWRLLECERGAFGTRPSAHTEGAIVGKLLDHPYKVFFPTMEMQNEIARTLAKRFNETGLSQMDFDGHEGCASTGQGDYAVEMFAKVFYDNLDHTVINGTSNSEHFYWHINSYNNWGEPWSEGFRESMQEYRINNQALFDRNFVPHMLGWYLLTETTTVGDMEWMLARAAGFNAGFAMATGLDALHKNADTGALLDAIREWESARSGGAFSDAQRGRLRNPKLEFHLASAGEGVWDLYELHASPGFLYRKALLQPGEPGVTPWEYENPDRDQVLQFRLRVVGSGGTISDPRIEIDKAATVSVPVVLKAGYSLSCEGTPVLRVYDEKGLQRDAVRLPGELPRITGGRHTIQFSCSFAGEPAPEVRLSLVTVGTPERVRSPAARAGGGSSQLRGRSHDLQFASLPKVWDEGFPLGNGMLGALLWQRDSVLRIALDRADLWDLRPVREFERPEFRFAWVVEQVLKGEYGPVHAMGDEPYDRDPAPTKLPGAALEFAIPDVGEVIAARLRLQDALCTVRWKNGIRLETFVQATEPRGWFLLTGKVGRVRPLLIPPPYATGDGSSGDGNSGPSGNDLGRLNYALPQVKQTGGEILYHQDCNGGFSYDVRVGWDRPDDTTLIGCWTIRPNAPYPLAGESPLLAVKGVTRARFQHEYARHARWWKEFWGKSSVALPDSVLETQYYRELYKFGSASRRGAPPITLQAVWTADNGRLPPWKGDFHNDLNTQLSYWPSYSSNHLTEGLAFLDWLWLCKPVSERWTRTYFGTSGLNVPGVATLAGEPMGGWIQYSLSPTTGAWLAHHFYMHWRYSMDRKFLRERAYPWLRGVATHIRELSVLDSAGRRTLPLSSSPEINDNRVTAWFRRTTNYDLSLIRWLFTAAAEMARELALSQEAVEWERVKAEWPELALSETDGTLLVAPGFLLPESHRHFSHLMAIHPLGLLDWDGGERDRRTIDASLAELERLGSDYWCGYSYSWLANMWARARNGEKAAQALRTFANCFCLPNSFHANGDQSRSGKSKFTYRPFTLEGNFAFAAGVQEMLLQSHTGTVRLFPAVPRSWSDVAFERLRAEGAFLVSAVRRGGEIVRVRIVSEKGETLRLANPFEGRTCRVRGVQLDPGALSKGVIEVRTKPGMEIVLSR